MKKEKIMISGILLALMVFIQACGLVERISYESKNKNIYMSANASDIRSSGLFFSTVLSGYKDAGVNFVTVSPKTIADYESLGKFSAVTYSSLAINEDYVSKAVSEALQPYEISEKCTVILSTDAQMSEYLRKNLIAKYSESFFIESVADENITAFALPECTDKNLVIGYDEEELYLINEAGLRICIEYPSYTYENEGYTEFFSEFISEYKPAFIILSENENDNKTELSAEMKKIFKNSEATLVTMENQNQISNEKPYLYKTLKGIFGNKTIRGFSTDKVDYDDKTLFMYRYYQWYNSVLERNTGFLNLNILKNPNVESEYNWNYTLKAVEKFKEKAENMNFSFPNEFVSVEYKYNLQTASMCGAVVLLALLYLYLLLLFGKKAEDKELYFLLSCALLIIFSFVFYGSITKYYAMLILILTSSLITLILFKLQVSELPHKTKVRSALICPMTLLAAAAVSITALLSDFEFFIGEKWFSDVIVTLVVPIILTFVNYFAVYIGSKENLDEFKNTLLSSVKKLPFYAVSGIVVLFVSVLAYYLIRSGKSELILPFENKLRNTLTDIFGIRPRFKEFFIGYPAFFLFIYYGFFRKKKIPSEIFGILQIILFTSVLNTFCHASTFVWVSVARTFMGFLCGFAISLIIIGILETICFISYKFKEKKENAIGNSIKEEKIEKTAPLKKIENEKVPKKNPNSGKKKRKKKK